MLETSILPVQQLQKSKLNKMIIWRKKKKNLSLKDNALGKEVEEEEEVMAMVMVTAMDMVTVLDKVLMEETILSEICSSNSLTESFKMLDHLQSHLMKIVASKRRKREERKREPKDLPSSLKMLLMSFTSQTTPSSLRSQSRIKPSGPSTLTQSRRQIPLTSTLKALRSEQHSRSRKLLN